MEYDTASFKNLAVISSPSFVTKSAQSNTINSHYTSKKRRTRRIKIIHVSIRPPRGTSSINNELNQSNHTSLGQKMNRSFESSIENINTASPIKRKDLSRSLKIAPHKDIIHSHRNDTEQGNQTDLTQDHRRKKKKKKKKNCPCNKSRLCLLLSILLGLLIAAVLAITLPLILTKSATTTTTTDCVTTTVTAEPLLYGPQLNFSLANLSCAWSLCYSALYSVPMYPNISSILATCYKDKLLLGCRPVGNTLLTLAAMGNRTDVLYNTSAGNSIIHVANGIGWYFALNTPGWNSWGFVLGSNSAVRGNCDGDMSTNPAYRLCWHTGGFSGGWRCGATGNLDTSTSWERVIYHAM